MTVAPNGTQQYTAIGNYSDGSTKNLTTTVTWSASTGASITAAGLATGLTPGATSTITATLGTVSGSATLSVSAVPLVSIAVTPATATVAPNGTQQFTATGTYADHSTRNITSSVTWNATAGATISQLGLATGLTPNTTSTITATQGNIVSNSATLTITNPLVSIAVTPSSASVAPNGTQQFTATGTYANNSTQNITTGVTWHATAGATITAGGLATGVTPNTTSTITATQGAIVSNGALLTITNPLVSIAVAPATMTLNPGQMQQYTATGTYANGSTQNITSSVTWSASLGATITAGGLATAVTPNTTSTIMAAQGNISGTATLTITNPLVSIAVTPVTVSIAQQTTQQYVATGTYADHSTQVLTTSVIWNSSNTTVATISNSQGTQGLATSGTTAGMTMITATMGTVTSPAATLTVTSATLVSIAVTPANPQIVYQTQQAFTATGTYSDSSTQNITNSVTWASSDTTKITITVSGIATGVNTTTSPVTISATKGTIVGSTTATVVPAAVVSIAITPNLTTLAQTTSRQYTATATLTNGSTLNVTNVATWSSSNTTIATVGLHSGLVTAQSVTNSSNPVNIQASYNGVNQTLALDVTNATAASVTVTPIAPTIPVGVSQRFSAVATFTDGSTQDVSQTATWTTSPTGIASISNLGIATGLTPGTTTVTATFETLPGNAQLTVSTATLTSIAVTPTSTILAPGSSITYQAVGHYSDGSTQFISNLVAWASDTPSVVSITTTGGVATGQSAGTANITATYQSVTSNMAGVLVTSSPLNSITITPSPGQVPEGVTLQFAATGTFASGQTQNLTTNVTWASSQPSIGTISNAVGQQGLATGVAPGQTFITAVFASVVSPQTQLNVTNATLVSIAITPSNPTVTHGNSVNFTATGTFSDGSLINLTTQVTWTSSAVTVATINSSGVANTASPGQTTITATFSNGINGTTLLTVQ